MPDVRILKLDPRYCQMVVLSGLLFYGAFGLGFDHTWLRAGVVLTAVLFFQYVATSLYRLPHFEWRSALISGLSLTLLFRANTIWILLLAAAVTIFSKFLIRYRDKHIFNPTNLGIASMLLLFDGAWVSPAQWGSKAIFVSCVALAGLWVVNRSSRSDVTLAFLIFYVGSLLARAIYLGDPLAIPLHQLKSGSLIIFAFFMISDPKTTPDTRSGRIFFAALVTAVAYYFRFTLYEPNALLYALVLCCVCVPFIDFISKGQQYRWSDAFKLNSRRFSLAPATT